MNYNELDRLSRIAAQLGNIAQLEKIHKNLPDFEALERMRLIQDNLPDPETIALIQQLSSSIVPIDTRIFEVLFQQNKPRASSKSVNDMPGIKKLLDSLPKDEDTVDKLMSDPIEDIETKEKIIEEVSDEVMKSLESFGDGHVITLRTKAFLESSKKALKSLNFGNWINLINLIIKLADMISR